MTKDVIDVEIVGDYHLILTFEGPERREIDLAGLLSFTGVFAPLEDPACFRKVYVDRELGTILWPNGADICPDVLYEKSQPVVEAALPSGQ